MAIVGSEAVPTGKASEIPPTAVAGVLQILSTAKSRGVRLGPLTKATGDAPGPTLWARCEAD
jgi:hypothetical protein